MGNIKLKNILAENMRRFGTKNLNEQSSVGEILGYTGSGKEIYNAKRSNGFTMEDFKDAADLLSDFAHEEFKAMRQYQQPDERGFGLVPTDINKFNQHSEMHDRLSDLHNYFFRKFKAMQSGTKKWTDPEPKRPNLARKFR
jgi:hypothetical protein